MRKKKDQWGVDKLGFVSNANNYFHIRDIKALTKTDDGKLIIALPSGGVGLTFHEKSMQSRDGIFDFLKGAMGKYEEYISKHHSEHYNQIKEMNKKMDKALKGCK